MLLHDLQVVLRDALLGGDAEAAAREIAGDGLAPEARLAVYRHHVSTTLTAALKATYPVICRLVDARFFAFAADRYLRAHPPASPCLFEYGASFPEFLAAFPPCRDLAYLPDVARLEWAMKVASHAEDVAVLDPSRLAAVEAADMPRLTFTFEPSVSLLASPWPIERIWRANQDDAASLVVDLGAGGTRLQIRRVEGSVGISVLDAGVHLFRTVLAEGSTLEQAAAAASAADATLDLTRAIHELLQERIVVDFAVSN